MKLVLHELHIDGAPESIALAEANMSFALRMPVRPGHMLQTLLQCGSSSRRRRSPKGLLLSQPLQGSPASNNSPCLSQSTRQHIAHHLTAAS